MSVSIFKIRIITFVKCHECHWFDLHHSVVNASMPVESYLKNHSKTSLDWNWYWLVGLFFYHYSNHIQPIHFQTFAEWKSSKLFVFFSQLKFGNQKHPAAVFLAFLFWQSFSEWYFFIPQNLFGSSSLKSRFSETILCFVTEVSYNCTNLSFLLGCVWTKNIKKICLFVFFSLRSRRWITRFQMGRDFLCH